MATEDAGDTPEDEVDHPADSDHDDANESAAADMSMIDVAAQENISYEDEESGRLSDLPDKV